MMPMSLHQIIYPTMPEKPIIGKFAIICIERYRCFADIFDLLVKKLKLFFVEGITSLLRVYTSMI